LYWDTSAILGCFSPGDGRFVGLLSELTGDSFATSTFVVTEAVRRLVKLNLLDQFIGPKGERGYELARLVLEAWLAEHRIQVLHPDPAVFDQARAVFLKEHRPLRCDLCDSLSYVMVKGLEQERIVAGDEHFKHMGLSCLP